MFDIQKAREIAAKLRGPDDKSTILDLALDEIERLRNEVEELTWKVSE